MISELLLTNYKYRHIYAVSVAVHHGLLKSISQILLLSLNTETRRTQSQRIQAQCRLLLDVVCAGCWSSRSPIIIICMRTESVLPYSDRIFYDWYSQSIIELIVVLGGADTDALNHLLMGDLEFFLIE